MEIITEIEALIKRLDDVRIKNVSIGFVPTMGALHQGHLSLIEQAKKENDLCVCSIFINPTQFDNNTDLENYPRNIKKDIEQLTKIDNDILFNPSVNEIYPDSLVEAADFSFGNFDKKMEGTHRAGHFKGVAQIVSRLLGIVQPHKLYLGQKDYQQYLIIKALLEQLKVSAELVMCPTVRESDGLAMSSRNVRLSPVERKEVALIYKTLVETKKKITTTNSVEDLKQWAINNLVSSPSIKKVEYFEIVDAGNLEDVVKWDPQQKTIACVAVNTSSTRLIDNIFLN